MRKLALFLIAGVALSGCVSTPDNPWDGLTVDRSAAAEPVDCGSFPMPTEVIGESIVYEDANALEAYRKCSEANEAIAEQHAMQIDQLKTAQQHLIEAGQAQRSIADMREEMLEDERKHNFFQTIGYWIVIIGMGSAL